jgi:hypothetical protein
MAQWAEETDVPGQNVPTAQATGAGNVEFEFSPLGANASVSLGAGGPHNGATLTFYGSDDGVLFYPLMGFRGDGAAPELSRTLAANATAVWWFCAIGLQKLRVVVSGWTGGASPNAAPTMTLNCVGSRFPIPPPCQKFQTIS